MRTILLPLALAAATQAQLVTFAAGSSAKASEVNSNFAFLAARLDSLIKALAAKDTLIASMGKRLDAGIPKGTIAAFQVGPGGDNYLPGSDGTWIFAAGQAAVNGVAIPDLRGRFLRGLDQSGSKNDPDTNRVAGSYQADAIQGHWHQQYVATFINSGGGGSATGSNNNTAKALDKGVKEPVSDGINGDPRTASETRPKNVAVYWYIKVK